jgi:glutaredoxin
MSSVTIFATETCSACKALAYQLNKLGVEYSYVVPSTPGYDNLREKFKLNPVTVPVTVIDFENQPPSVITGVQPERIADEVREYELELEYA